MFELLVALCLLSEISGLELDRGRGDNPDLLFRYRDRTWGLACKRLYSSQPARFRDTVRKAIAQIENSTAETGLVFVSLTNVLDHEAFYVMDGDAYIGLNRELMLERLDSEQDRLQSSLVGCTDRDLAEEFVGMKAMPGVIHYLGTTCLMGTAEQPTLKTIQRAWSRGEVGELLDAFQNGLNSTSSQRGAIWS